MTGHAIADTTYDGFPAVALRSPDGVVATYAPTVGMVGCSLTHDGDELLAQRGGLAKYAASGSTFGIPLLHPWANRLGGFEYDAAGRHATIDPDSPRVRLEEHGLPIHGLLAASPHWEVMAREAADDEARLSASLAFGAHDDLLAAFPFPHTLAMDVRLRRTGLTVATTITPTGDTAVPLAFGFHPYLRLPDVPRAEWRVTLPVTRHLLLDDRSIPTGGDERAGDLDGPLADRSFDDGYADLEGDPPTFALEGGGRRIAVTFTSGYPFAQVFAPAEQELACFEPMTAPTNALRSGASLHAVEPGATFTAVFELRVTRE